MSVKFSAFIIVVLLMGVLVSCSCYWLKGYKEDNIIEELIEDVIEAKTGIDFDLSPSTPEYQ